MTTTRATFAACMFAAFVAGTLTPRFASAPPTVKAHSGVPTYAPFHHSHPTHGHPYAPFRHSHPTHEHPTHEHPYADRSHRHPAHTHPYAADQHVHEVQEHTHDTAPEHTHEAPDPPAQACTYKHRITGIPGTTGGGYTGQILISSEVPNATARIRAFQHDNGHPIDVLDKEGRAVESVTLSPAHSVKTFRLEGAQGWHTAIIVHDSARAMRSAAVALRIRSPDVGVSVVPVQGIEHCEPATDTGPVTETDSPTEPETPTPRPTTPDLAVRDAHVHLQTAVIKWTATVENIGSATARGFRISLHYGERRLAARRIGTPLLPGRFIIAPSANGSGGIPGAGSTVRICVDPMPGEPESKRANNCASVTVEEN